MKNVALIAGVLVTVALTPALLPAGGDRESRNDQPAPTVTQPAARRQMRRLATVGARLRTDGGSYVAVQLPQQYQDQDPPRGHNQFSTDFSRALISYDDIVAGGPPKGGIPSIDNPQFTTVTDAGSWLQSDEAVIAVSVDGITHLYPLQILMWHEIVNDVVGTKPLAVTYCPLCNTGIVFERTLDDELMDFGVSGNLIYSNMIMFDRQTETWWIQATGRGIAGRYAGQQLALHPSMLLSWREAQQAFPQARVLSRDTGHRRDYGRNPYGGYDRADQPFLYRGPEVIDTATENPMTRVLSVYHGEEAVAVDFPLLQAERVVQRTIDGTPVVVFWAPGTASALDTATVAGGRDVGTANAFYPVVNGQILSFRRDDDQIVDERSGSRWSVAGRAVDGRFEGAQLEPALSVHHFLFSWRAFHPDAE